MDLPDALMRDFSAYLTQHVGLWFPAERQADLNRGMSRLAQARGLPSAEACMHEMMAHAPQQAEIEMLALYLSVGETYFFRDPALFKILEQEVLPGLIDARRRAGTQHLKIWSAGCCTGEELYSLAIVLSRLLPDFDQWQLDLLGSDINPQFLAKASRGVYRDWSFRNLAPQIRHRYFSETVDGGYAILPSLKRRVSFRYHNLAGNSAPPFAYASDIDLIVCRNVLMYFDPQQMQHAANQLYLNLADHGWLVVSSAEGGHPVFAQFEPRTFPEALLYRKTEAYRDAAKPRELASWLKPESGIAGALGAAGAAGMATATATAASAATAVMPRPAALALSPAATLKAQAVPARVEVKPALPYEQALRHYEQGEHEQAVAILLADPAAGPASLELLARAYADLGNLDAALHWAETALTADKCNPSLRYLLALVHEERGQHEAAITAFKQAVYLDPDYVLAHFGLGSAYRRLGNMQEAQRHFNNAADLLRKTPSAQALADAQGITAGHLGEIIQREDSA
jgi:chemotaxis protein methyltransferase CheR